MSGRRLEAAYGDAICFFSERSPVRDGGVASFVSVLFKNTEEYYGIPDSSTKFFLDESLEGIEIVLSRDSGSVARRLGLRQILPYGLAVIIGKFTDAAYRKPLAFEFGNLVHIGTS